MDQRIFQWACLSCAPSSPNLLHVKQQNPNLEGIIIFFPTGSYSMACDFKVLILIRALTHSAKIHPKLCWRKQLIIRYVLKYKYDVWQSTNLSSVYSKRIFYYHFLFILSGSLWEKGIILSLLFTHQYFNIIKTNRFAAWYFEKHRVAPMFFPVPTEGWGHFFILHSGFSIWLELYGKILNLPNSTLTWGEWLKKKSYQ